MSRIGRKPIEIPLDCEVKIEGKNLTVKGPRGELSFNVDGKISLAKNQKMLVVTRTSQDRRTRALHGLTRALAANMITGVTKGFAKRLEIRGVGYRAQVEGNNLVLSLGYSHTLTFPIPLDISLKVEKNIVTIVGSDKAKVGEVAAQIRKLRPPDAYKGKGIRYLDEQIKLKPGKIAKSAAGGTS